MVKSLRTFIGSNDFEVSRSFYRDWGFSETNLGPDMCYFEVSPQQGFYLQNYRVRDWIENTMMFLEVQDLDQYLEFLQAKGLVKKYPGVRIKPIQNDHWGREFFIYDPAGILWHIGKFN